MARAPRSPVKRPTKLRTLEADPVEVLAMRLVLSTLLTVLARKYERDGDGSVEDFIGLLAETMREFTGGLAIDLKGQDQAAFQAALEHHLSTLLGAIPRERGRRTDA